jgi:hypothetical protein
LDLHAIEAVGLTRERLLHRHACDELDLGIPLLLQRRGSIERQHGGVLSQASGGYVAGTSRVSHPAAPDARLF